MRTTIVGLNENKNKQGFAEWIINSNLSKKKISLFSDVVFTPISIWDLGKELYFLIKSNNINSEILHITGSEITTKYEFGIRLCEALNLNINLVEEGQIANFGLRVNRSNDQTLGVSNYSEKYNRRLPDTSQTIESLKENYNE